MPSTSTLAPAEIDYYPDCSPRQVDEVLKLLEDWNDRAATHFTSWRKHERRGFRAMVVVEALSGGETRQSDGTPRAVYHVQARNISLAGMCLVAPPAFAPKLASDETPLVKTAGLLMRGAALRLEVPNAVGALWLRGEVVRLRTIHQGFYEAGVRLTGKD
jgi:hypothetical protein